MLNCFGKLLFWRVVNDTSYFQILDIGRVYLPGEQPLVLDRPEQQLPVPSFANANEIQLTVEIVFNWLLD